MEACIRILNIGIGDGHPVLNGHVEALVAEAVHVEGDKLGEYNTPASILTRAVRGV